MSKTPAAIPQQPTDHDPLQQLLTRIEREFDGTVPEFTEAVGHMGGVIEVLYHVIAKARDLSEGRDEIDWHPIVTMLRASRAKFPYISSAVNQLRYANPEAGGGR